MTADNATRAFLGTDASWAAAVMTLEDVQPLWGGRRIRTDGDGSTTVSVVARGLRERRYVFRLNASTVRALLEAFVAADFVTLRPPERPGLPDEARPVITLANAAGEQRTVAMWAGEHDPGFAAVYAAFRKIESLTAALTPVFDVRFELGRPYGH